MDGVSRGLGGFLAGRAVAGVTQYKIQGPIGRMPALSAATGAVRTRQASGSWPMRFGPDQVHTVDAIRFLPQRADYSPFLTITTAVLVPGNGLGPGPH
jgi:hypothetical protein